MSCYWDSPGNIIFGGDQSNLVSLKYVATGFMYTRKEIYSKIQEVEKLPECNKGFERSMVPYFMPMIVQEGEEYHYLGDDYCFCERICRAGYNIVADTSVRLWHIGKYKYSWEDAVFSMNRQNPFTMKLSDKNLK